MFITIKIFYFEIFVKTEFQVIIMEMFENLSENCPEIYWSYLKIKCNFLTVRIEIRNRDFFIHEASTGFP